jgi:S-adenosylmethionine-diacylglycerol 3-amino-3-carboxypropyl transferase
VRRDGAGTGHVEPLRYAQCWEDADILLEALDIRPGDVCLSVASAGDNALAMLAQGPARVIAVDVSPAQLACLELRVAAYRRLRHQEMLELIGSLPSVRRGELYRRCRTALSPGARRFWDGRPAAVLRGIGHAGRFERYFTVFRACVLPLIHPKDRVDRLLQGGPRERREALYRDEWDTWRWRLLFRMFFSRVVMARLGRDPTCFRYVDGHVAGRLIERVRHGLTVLNPVENPYLQWILTGRHGAALPYALRPENFDRIRDGLDRLEWRCGPVEDFLEACDDGAIDRFNLSDVFEYMSVDRYHELLERVLRAGRRGGRLAYWNMLVERRRPAHLADRLRPSTELSRRLHERDKAFFYAAFIVEEIL